MHIRQSKTLKILFSPLLWSTKLLGKYCPELLVKIRYRIRFHKKLNLDNPKTLNEKILYFSLRTDTTQWTRLADKYAVRQYVEECGLKDILVKLYAHWTNEKEVDLNSLPDEFVIKSVQGCGDVIVVMDKWQMNCKKVLQQIHYMLNNRYGALEGGKHYLRIQPAVIVEELLSIGGGEKSLIDYKLWCINGTPKYILTCRNRSKHGKDVMLYDTEWNAHPEYRFFNKNNPKDEVIPKPLNLETMLDVATKLARPFPIVRVDLYNVNGKVYFGEMTFTSLGGMMNCYTSEFLLKIGNQIDLNYKG